MKLIASDGVAVDLDFEPIRTLATDPRQHIEHIVAEINAERYTQDVIFAGRT